VTLPSGDGWLCGRRRARGCATRHAPHAHTRPLEVTAPL
jgi:hypothetical protein